MLQRKPESTYPIGWHSFGTYAPKTAGPALMLPEEIETAAASIPRGGRYLELGTWCGSGAALIADRRPDIKIVSVDSFPGFPGGPFLWWLNARDNMTLFAGSVAAFIEICQPGLFDVVLVDADHAEKSTTHDLHVATKLVAPGGIILAHDYTPEWPGVIQAVDTFCQMTAWRICAQTKTLVTLCHDRQP